MSADSVAMVEPVKTTLFDGVFGVMSAKSAAGDFWPN
jgi:hypothetical protein